MKDKLFFFGSWERYQGRRGVQSTYVAPTALMRAGNFSEVAAAYPSFRLYNPYTGGPGGAGRQEFSGFQIPTNLLNATSQKVLADWPMPNSSVDINRNGILDDIVIPRTVTNDRDNFDVKLTWQRNNMHSVWAKFGMLDAEVVDHSSASTTAARRHAHTSARSATPGRSAPAGVDGNPASMHGADRHRARLRRQLRHRPPASRAPTATTSGRASCFRHHRRRRTRANTTTSALRTGACSDRAELHVQLGAHKVMTKHELRFGIDVVKHELNHFRPSSAALAACGPLHVATT
jgi:hypothetical protein